QDDSVTFVGRSLLTAQAPPLFQDKIQDYLANNSTLNTDQLQSLLTTVGDWDLLSQSLSGLMDQLITLLSQEVFPPSGTSGPTSCSQTQSGTTPSPVPTATVVGDQYHAMPVLSALGSAPNQFFPVLGGFLQIEKLQVVDAFGQIYPITFESGYPPILSTDLTPTTGASGLPFGAMQLAPRVVQATRLDLRFLANDGSGLDVLVSDNPNAICGWLLPNHLDGAIAVYDADGVLLGELLPLPPPGNWRPRPGPPGNNPPPQQPADIPNPTLNAVVSSFAAQTADVFEDVLNVIDETLWMVDPLGGRKDQFLSVLIGRPLAVAQVEMQLSLLGDPVYNQIWTSMLGPDQGEGQGPSWQQDIGNVEQVPFPVRLGSLELRDDGLIGYFLPAESYANFYTVHYPEEMSSGDTFVTPIVTQVNGQGQYNGNIELSCQGAAVTATLILDPRGSVHAYTGILPVVREALGPNLVENLMRQLMVTFQTGPIIADPGTLRIPQPAESQGAWAWLQPVAAPTDWEVDQIVDADDQARLPDTQLQLREGWLQLTQLED
ncbi:MAG TPA: hypothetical protein VND68_12755, partial [Chloroflexia bacterium]|nr:hypothetical protein [Chloroflexia bacterium]